MSFALSTSWNAFRWDNGRSLIFEIKGLGFKEVELSFNLTFTMVNDILDLVKNKEIAVVSLHNYCPIPMGLPREIALPDYYSMSSLDDRERELAVINTKKTIETAANIGAKIVVLHCGRVEIPDKTRELLKIYASGIKNPQRFLSLRNQAIVERKASAQVFLNNTLKSLEELVAYAKKYSVMLGIENRFYYREIPSLQEIGIILDKFKGSGVFYWHDTGHAQIMENLGFTSHKEYLDRYGNLLLGTHLHDILGCDDHRAPGEGKFDFSLLKGYLKENTVKVLEPHHPASPEAVKKSKSFLESLFNGKT